MEIQIITKKVKGRFLRNLLPSPFAIFKGNLANWSLQVKIKNFTGQENIWYTWVLSYGQNYNNFMMGSTKKLKIQTEQLLKWSFIPSQSGEQRLELLIVGLDTDRDIVLDDYGTKLKFYSSEMLEGHITIRYPWWFEVESFREIVLFWFAIVSTIGAIFEILTFFLK